jgi:hypothetical protein
MFLHTALPLPLYLLQAFARDYGGRDLTSLEKIIYFLLVVFVGYFIVKLIRDVEPTNHWQHHFDALHYSSKEFYQTLEDVIAKKEMPNLKVSRVALTESGFGSPQREYLRIERNHLLFDICAAPFGHRFFVSWWQGERKNFIHLFIAAIPFAGKYLERALFPTTYYIIDTEEMFKQSIHTVVLTIVDEITKEKGIRGLTELERKPIEAKR